MASVIHGRFSSSGAPFVHASVIIPGLVPQNRTRILAPFLLDTGATYTCLHPRVALALGIDHSHLNYSERSTGIGGHSLNTLADGVMLFSGDDFDIVCPVSFRIAQPTEHNEELPSLLGRDVLRQLNLRYEPANDILQLISNDSTIVLSA